MRNSSKSSRSKSSTAEKTSKKKKPSGSDCNIVFIVVALMIVSIISVAVFTIPDKDIRLKMTLSSIRHIFSKPASNPVVASPINLRTQPPNVVTIPTTIAPVVKTEEAKEDDTPAPARISTPPPTKKGKHKKFDMHFIHIPKCGGTTMTTVLRQIQCALDPVKNVDCCTNPGFCDWHAKRRCSVIQGCINHFANREFIFENMPSIAVFREPSSRVLSAWFYRGHNPNLDFFQVRPEFKLTDENRRKYTFEEYLEMPEYHNIMVRMLGADSFPYKNITIDEELFDKAVEAINGLFFIGVQEEFEASALAIVRMMNVNVTVDLTNERENGGGKVGREKKEIRENAKLMQRVREVNNYDLRLWELVVERFCVIMSQYSDLYEKIKARGKIKCK